MRALYTTVSPTVTFESLLPIHETLLSIIFPYNFKKEDFPSQTFLYFVRFVVKSTPISSKEIPC